MNETIHSEPPKPAHARYDICLVQMLADSAPALVRVPRWETSVGDIVAVQAGAVNAYGTVAYIFTAPSEQEENALATLFGKVIRTATNIWRHRWGEEAFT